MAYANATGLDEFDGDLFRGLILGTSGSGKTTLAGSLAELGKVLYAYTVGEEGINSLRGEEWADNLDVVRIEDPTEIRDIGHHLVEDDHGYVGFVLDSWSAMDRMFRKYLLGLEQNQIRDFTTGLPFMEINDWGNIADITMDVMTSMFSLASHTRDNPIHVVMTSQVSEYEDEEDKVHRVGAAVSKGCRTHVHSVPDYVLHCIIGDDPDSMEVGDSAHRVMLKPDERYFTKLHTEMERARKTPKVVGDSNSRLTMKKFFKMMGVPH